MQPLIQETPTPDMRAFLPRPDSHQTSRSSRTNFKFKSLLLPLIQLGLLVSLLLPVKVCELHPLGRELYQQGHQRRGEVPHARRGLELFLQALQVLGPSLKKDRSHSLRRGKATRLLLGLVDVDAIMGIGR